MVTYIFLFGLWTYNETDMRNAKPLPILSLGALLLSSCSPEYSPDVFAKGEIAGDDYFSSLIVKLDADNKKVTVTYKDFESSPCELSFKNKKLVITHEETDWLGITNHYEKEFFFYKAELTDAENGRITSMLKETVEEKTEGKDFQNASTLRGLDFVSVGVVIYRSLVNGKDEEGVKERSYAVTFANGYAYDGNDLFNLYSL